MKTRHTSLSTWNLLAFMTAPAALLYTGCGTASTETPDEEEEIGVTAQPIAKEVTGKAEIMGRHLMDNPGLTLASYAMPSIPGCSATMIGPDTLMTAAHCGYGPYTATFHTFNNGASPTAQITENFSCQYLLFTYPDTDMNLFYCAPNAAGERPGDKYGYVDFDLAFKSDGTLDIPASEARSTPGNAVYSVWSNGVADQSIGNTKIYSAGSITSNTGSGWYTPQTGGNKCIAEGSVNIGTNTNVYSNPGASGSSQLSPTTNRVLVGPQSVGPTEGQSRGALRITDFMRFASVVAFEQDGCGKRRSSINSSLLATWGIDGVGNAYRPWIDPYLVGVFEIQRDVERALKDAVKTTYWLGFESARRNRTWNMYNGSFTRIYDTWGEAVLTGVGGTGAWVPVMDSGTLTVPASTDYRINFWAKSPDAGASALVCAGQQCLQTVVSQNTWSRYSFTVNSGAGGKVAAWVTNGKTVNLYGLTITKPGASVDFDNHDTRVQWSNPVSGKKPFILPFGNGTGADWAAAVTKSTSGTSTTTEWSLANDFIGAPGGNLKVCFDVKTNPAQTMPAGAQGAMRVRAPNGLLVLNNVFPVTGTWMRWCFNNTTHKASQEISSLQLGVDKGTGTGSYLVDNVTLSN